MAKNRAGAAAAPLVAAMASAPCEIALKLGGGLLGFMAGDPGGS